MQNSMKKAVGAVGNVEDSVEALVRKLEQEGKKVKIIGEEEEEVEPQNNNNAFSEKIKEIQSLEAEKEQVSADKAKIEDELKQKEDRLRIEREEKEKLSQLIGEMEQKLMSGGQALEEREREQAQKYREYQLQLKK